MSYFYMTFVIKIMGIQKQNLGVSKHKFNKIWPDIDLGWSVRVEWNAKAIILKSGKIINHCNRVMIRNWSQFNITSGYWFKKRFWVFCDFSNGLNFFFLENNHKNLTFHERVKYLKWIFGLITFPEHNTVIVHEKRILSYNRFSWESQK